MLDSLKFDYKKQFKTLIEYITRLRTVLTIVALCGIFGFAIIRIDNLSNPEPDQARLDEQSTTLRKVTFDEEVIDQIQGLIDSGITIDAEFDPDRDNPFTN